MASAEVHTGATWWGILGRFQAVACLFRRPHTERNTSKWMKISSRSGHLREAGSSSGASTICDVSPWKIERFFRGFFVWSTPGPRTQKYKQGQVIYIVNMNNQPFAGRDMIYIVAKAERSSMRCERTASPQEAFVALLIVFEEVAITNMRGPMLPEFCQLQRLIRQMISALPKEIQPF